MCLGHELTLRITPKTRHLEANPALVNGLLVKTEDRAVDEVVVKMFDPRVEEEPVANEEKSRKRRKIKAEPPNSGESGGVVVEHSSPPVPAKNVPRIKREYVGKAKPPVVEACEDPKPATPVQTDSTPEKRAARGTKKALEHFVTTLVHGDILFLSGDDFDVRARVLIFSVPADNKNLSILLYDPGQVSVRRFTGDHVPLSSVFFSAGCFWPTCIKPVILFLSASQRNGIILDKKM